MRLLFTILFVVIGLNSAQAFGSYQDHQSAIAFIDDMVTRHGFQREDLTRLFAEAEKKDSILEAISRPAEKRLEWAGYRKIFLTEDRIKRGKKFMERYRVSLEKAEQEFGVPAELITAIIGVETRYGNNKGNYRVVDALSTLAFDYPPRSKFFTKELEQVLLLAKEQGFTVTDLKGSYAGAMGYGQFIPSSYRHYAIDFDKDGVADILDNPVDAIGSVANYFVKHKWRSGEPVAFQTQVEGEAYQDFIRKKLKPVDSLADLSAAGVAIPERYKLDQQGKLLALKAAAGTEFWLTLHNFYVITRYNHSHLYAMAVFQLASELEAEK